MVKDSTLFDAGKYSRDWIKPFYTQSAIWWGSEPHDSAEEHTNRLKIINRLCGKGKKRILDLGCGPGGTPDAFADAGHDVVGVELNPTDIAYARERLGRPHKGDLQILEGDFYTIQLEGCFDVVTWWEGFGLGSDVDQRFMLRRIANEWLAEDGCLVAEVYLPARPARHHGEAIPLDALEGVPGSVEMVEKCHFDVVNSRWIDEWQPTKNQQHALAQTLRCYSPADLLLLLEGTGLTVTHMEIEGDTIDYGSQKIYLCDRWLNSWSYLVKLVHSN